MKIRRPIFLCGYTSCGKTTIGRVLAEHLSLPFFDTDALLIEQSGMTIPEIYALGGDALFRSLEHEAAAGVCRLGPAVVSTGGGLLARQDNADLLAESGTIVWIRRPFSACYESIAAAPERPLFQNNTKEQLAARYEARAAVYARLAHISVDNDCTPLEAAEKIVRALEAGAAKPAGDAE